MTKDRPDIVFFPPIGCAVAILAAWLLHEVVPFQLLPPFPWWPGVVVGMLVIGVAIFAGLSGIRAFRRAGTNVEPYKPALKIVRDGPYQYTRNPMYLGMVALTLGLGPLFSNLWALVCGLTLWAALHFGVVLREEAYLEAKFGEEYRALKAATRRWL